jgi:hypothetical protein
MTLLRVRCTCRGRCLVGVFVGLVVFFVWMWLKCLLCCCGGLCSGIWCLWLVGWVAVLGVFDI